MDAQHARPVEMEDSHPLSNSGQRAATPFDSSLSLDLIFDLLSNERRRTTLLLLREADTPVGFDEVVRVVAEVENDKPIEEVKTNERRTVYSALQQTHLSRLKEAGVIEYDRVTGSIDTGEKFDELDYFLRQLDGEDQERSLRSRIGGALAALR